MSSNIGRGWFKVITQKVTRKCNTVTRVTYYSLKTGKEWKPAPAEEYMRRRGLGIVMLDGRPVVAYKGTFEGREVYFKYGVNYGRCNSTLLS